VKATADPLSLPLGAFGKLKLLVGFGGAGAEAKGLCPGCGSGAPPNWAAVPLGFSQATHSTTVFSLYTIQASHFHLFFICSQIDLKPVETPAPEVGLSLVVAFFTAPKESLADDAEEMDDDNKREEGNEDADAGTTEVADVTEVGAGVESRNLEALHAGANTKEGRIESLKSAGSSSSSTSPSSS